MTASVLTLYTAAVAYRGDDRCDVSRGTGRGVGLLLAPSGRLLGWIKDQRQRQRVTPEVWREYLRCYTAEVSPHASTVLVALADRGPTATLVCHCRDRECHHHAAAQVLVAAARDGVAYEGERP